MPVSQHHLKGLLKKKTSKTSLLAKWPNNKLYYLVQPLKYDVKKDECLVKYEDSTESWTPRIDLHLQFCSFKNPYETDDDIMCCLCEGGNSESPNEIVICDTCQQGFHQDCCKPRIETFVEQWNCETCQYILGPSAAYEPLGSSTPRPEALETTVDPDDSLHVTSSSDESKHKIEHLENGITIEKMQPAIIDVAKALVEKEANNICTNEFVEILAPEPRVAKKTQLPISKTTAKVASKAEEKLHAKKEPEIEKAKKPKGVPTSLGAAKIARVPRKTAIPRAA